MLVSPITIVLIAGVHNGSHELGLPNVSPGHRLHGGFYPTNQSFHPLLHCLSLYVCISTLALILPGCRQPSDRRQRMPLRPLQSPLLRCQGLRLGLLPHKRDCIVKPVWREQKAMRWCTRSPTGRRVSTRLTSTFPGLWWMGCTRRRWNNFDKITKRSDHMLIST